MRFTAKQYRQSVAANQVAHILRLVKSSGSKSRNLAAFSRYLGTGNQPLEEDILIITGQGYFLKSSTFILRETTDDNRSRVVPK